MRKLSAIFAVFAISAIFAILAIFACGATVAAGGPTDGRENTKLLADKLASMGMFELLEAYAAEIGDPLKGQEVLAQAKITRAQAGRVDAETRDRLLNEAAGILERAIKRREDDSRIEAVVERLKLMFDLVEAGGLLRAKPHALRLMYLQGSRLDRDALVEITGKIQPQLQVLNSELDYTIQDCREDLTKLVTVLPELEELQQALKYKSAWLRFYRGMAVTDPLERSTLLNNAIIGVEEFARDEESGVMYWSHLLRGMCAREMKQYRLARRELDAAGAASAPPGARVQAMFEIARTLIESGEFALAVEAVGRFETETATLLGPAGRLEVDVKSAILSHYLYEKWAEGQADGEVRKKHLISAQGVLLKFLGKYADQPEVRAAFLDVFAAKYADREDYENLTSVILLAIARGEAPAGTSDAQARSAKLLQLILDRDDEISRKVRPDAIWELAGEMNRRRMNLEAGRMFLRVSEEYPDHALALKAARNAVYTFSGVIEARRRQRTLIAPNLRREFARALEVLLGRWGRQKGMGKWYFDLGWQYQQLAGTSGWDLMTKAVIAYDRLPPTLPESMEGRFLALKLRTALLAAPRQWRPDPKRLLAESDRFSLDAEAGADESAESAVSSRLREWGAMSAFWAAQILYEKLDRQADALSRLRQLPQRWADTEILSVAWEFEISKLVERNETRLAIEKVDAFEKKHPQRARELIKLVVRQIRRRVEALRNDPARAEELQTYQTVFERFATELYKDAAAKNLPPEKMYHFQQMQADAFLNAGKSAQALELYRRCAAYDARLRREAAGRIDEQVARALAGVNAAADSVNGAKTLVKEFLAMLKRDGIDPGTVGPAGGLGASMRYLDQAGQSKSQQERLAAISQMLRESWEAYGEVRKRALPIDVGNVRGLARAYRALKKYKSDGAVKAYNQLVAGIDRSRHPQLYWSSQLERCQCLLEAFSDEPEQLKRLGILIRQLGLEDGAMGGFFGRFNAIQAEVDKLVK